MSVSSRPDYGAKGCCGTAVFALLAVVSAGVVLLVGWFA